MTDNLININNDIDAYLNVMSQIGAEYGVHVELVETFNGFYLTACPFSESIDRSSIEIEADIKANDSLFLVNEFSINASEHDSVFVAESLIEYCMKAEFIHTIYNEFEAPVPNQIRNSELYHLIDFNDGRFDEAMPIEVKNDYTMALTKFFRDENKDGYFHKKWREFYRSEKYDNNGSFLKNFSNFLTRNKNEINLKLLIDSSNGLKSLEMEKKQYDEFKDRIKTFYPDLSYSVDKKTIVIDHGQLEVPKEMEGQIYNPWEGEQSHWEFIKIYYNEADEYKIAQVFNSIRLNFAKDKTLNEIEARGKIAITPVPVMDFINFVSLMKANNVPYHVDDGKHARPELDKVYIVYNEYNQEKIERIFARMIHDKTYNYHAISDEQRENVRNVTLNQRLENAKNIRLSQASDFSNNPKPIER